MADQTAAGKEAVARAIAARVEQGQVIGVGTGSTVDCALIQIAERLRSEQLAVMFVPSSIQTAWRCQELGLVTCSMAYEGAIAWGFDGADEIDDRCWAIKGRGGAMLQEKILAKKCARYLLAIDEGKHVGQLGANTAVPVEVVPEARSLAKAALEQLGARSVTLREGSGKHGPILTEAGNIILDAHFPSVDQGIESRIKQLVGVVESGLFIGYADEVLIGSDQGVRTIIATR